MSLWQGCNIKEYPPIAVVVEPVMLPQFLREMALGLLPVVVEFGGHLAFWLQVWLVE